MIIIGQSVSVDYVTFFAMLFILMPGQMPRCSRLAGLSSLFVHKRSFVLIIRTRRVPFYKSKPSKYLTIMLLSVISFAVIVPYTPIGAFFGFVPPPFAFYLVLAGILGAYAVLAETVKRFFYKRYVNV